MADWPYSPDFGYEITPKFNTITKEYASGIDQVRLVTTKKKRSYEFQFSRVRQAERDAAEAFYNSHYGATNPFTMEIDGEVVTGRFVEGSFKITKVGPGIYDYTFQFQEIY